MLVLVVFPFHPVPRRGHVVETGRIALSGPAAELASDGRVAAAYLGGR